MKEGTILVVGLSPAIQKTLLFPEFKLDQVNRSEKFFTDAAGKSINISRVLVQAGMDVVSLTVTGKENGEQFSNLCDRDRIPLEKVQTEGRVRTCTTLLNLKDNSCTEVIANEPERIKGEEEKDFQKTFLSLLKGDPAAVILAGSRLPGFSSRIIPDLLKECSKTGIPFYADFKGEDLRNSFITKENCPALVKINAEEFLHTFHEYSDLEGGLKAISRLYSAAWVITRGSDSSILASKGELSTLPSKKVMAINPIGCGDSMTAGIVQGLVMGKDLTEAVVLGRDYAAKNALSVHPGWIIEQKMEGYQED